MAAAVAVGFPSTSMNDRIEIDDELERRDAMGDVSSSESNRSGYLQENQWAAYVNAIKDTMDMLNPDEELQDLEAAEQIYGTIEEEREALLERMEGEVKELAKQHEAAARDAQRPSSHPPSSAHTSQVRDLERQQVNLGKSINEEEAGVVRRQSDLRDLKARKEEVMGTDVGAEMPPDSKVIRLKLLSDMGFSYIPSESESPAKILIRNDTKLDVHTVKLDNNRAKAYYANLIWSKLGDDE